MLKLNYIKIKPRSPYHASRNTTPNFNVIPIHSIVPICEKCKYSLKENGELVCKYFYSTVTIYDKLYAYYRL
jgi:hypothetical protein